MFLMKGPETSTVNVTYFVTLDGTPRYITEALRPALMLRMSTKKGVVFKKFEVSRHLHSNIMMNFRA
jgi:hypothetical protein